MTAINAMGTAPGPNIAFLVFLHDEATFKHLAERGNRAHEWFESMWAAGGRRRVAGAILRSSYRRLDRRRRYFAQAHLESLLVK